LRRIDRLFDLGIKSWTIGLVAGRVYGSIVP